MCYDASTQRSFSVYWPPVTGAYLGNIKLVEVQIQRQVKTSLVPAEAAFNPVRARGVAGPEPLNNGYAIMALDRGATRNAFNTQSTGRAPLDRAGILLPYTCQSIAATYTSTPHGA